MVQNYIVPEDFLNDESFLEWIKGSDDASVAYWENWLNDNPAKKEIAFATRTFFESVYVKETISDAQLKEAEQKLFEYIQTKKSPKIFSLYKKTWWSVAAAVFVIVVSVVVWQYAVAHASLKTSFGQIAQRSLPDGSEVTLNANSSISYNKWNENTDREVWIKGEAFFHVKKTTDHRRFIVHANHFDVIVTGTQFNVVNRDDKTNVMLTEGSVTIKKDDGEEIKMKPGDFIELDNNQFVKKEEKKENILAWKERKLYFDNTPMSEVANIIQQQYGVTVKISDDSTAEKTISGIMPNTSLDLLLSSLEATSDFKISRKNNEIIIEKP
jgi:ferric-dicitrate binding protein FerR (iron transport regulator)